jgi:hypothetical protein
MDTKVAASVRLSGRRLRTFIHPNVIVSKMPSNVHADWNVPVKVRDDEGHAIPCRTISCDVGLSRMAPQDWPVPAAVPINLYAGDATAADDLHEGVASNLASGPIRRRRMFDGYVGFATPCLQRS